MYRYYYYYYLPIAPPLCVYNTSSPGFTHATSTVDPLLFGGVISGGGWRAGSGIITVRWLRGDWLAGGMAGGGARDRHIASEFNDVRGNVRASRVKQLAVVGGGGAVSRGKRIIIIIIVIPSAQMDAERKTFFLKHRPDPTTVDRRRRRRLRSAKRMHEAAARQHTKHRGKSLLAGYRRPTARALVSFLARSPLVVGRTCARRLLASPCTHARTTATYLLVYTEYSVLRVVCTYPRHSVLLSYYYHIIIVLTYSLPRRCNVVTCVPTPEPRPHDLFVHVNDIINVYRISRYVAAHSLCLDVRVRCNTYCVNVIIIIFVTIIAISIILPRREDGCAVAQLESKSSSYSCRVSAPPLPPPILHEIFHYNTRSQWCCWIKY